MTITTCGRKRLPNKSQEEALDRIFFALSDRNRRKVLKILSKNGASVGEIAKVLAISLPATLKHLGVLQQAQLITQEKHGRVRSCAFSAKGFNGALMYIKEYKKFWESRFDRIESLLNDTE